MSRKLRVAISRCYFSAFDCMIVHGSHRFYSHLLRAVDHFREARGTLWFSDCYWFLRNPKGRNLHGIEINAYKNILHDQIYQI